MHVDVYSQLTQEEVAIYNCAFLFALLDDT